ARFRDKTSAIVCRQIGLGRVVHFAWLPGGTYYSSTTGKQDGLPVGYSDAVRHWIIYPTQVASIRAPVVLDRPMVEAPVLLSAAGAAVTVLNWTGDQLAGVSLTIRAPFPVRSV